MNDEARAEAARKFVEDLTDPARECPNVEPAAESLTRLTPEAATLERQIVADPLDDAKRLVFADMLREQASGGDAMMYTAWADLITRQVEYLAAACARCRRKSGSSVGGRGPMCDRCDYERGVSWAESHLRTGFRTGTGFDGHEEGTTLQVWLSRRMLPPCRFGLVAFRRGFPDVFALSHAAFISCSAWIARRTPALAWHLTDIDPAPRNPLGRSAVGDGDHEEEARLGFGWGQWAGPVFDPSREIPAKWASGGVATRFGGFRHRYHRDAGNILHPHLYAMVRRMGVFGGRASIDRLLWTVADANRRGPESRTMAQARRWLRWGCNYYARCRAGLPDLHPIDLDPGT